MDNKQKQIKYALKFKRGGNILELGSGKGEFLDCCKDAGVKVTGVDHYADKSDRRIIKSDARAFLKKAKKNSYDGIYARHFVEHFEADGLINIFKMAENVLKKDGVFLMIFPNLRNIHVATYEFWSDPTHARPYTGEALAVLLDKAGFKIKEHGPDADSWDNSPFKNIIRGLRAFLSGVRTAPPDYYIYAVKKKS
ncbi:MAG: class I SAM-dependent methyltransferase [Candidatus Goldbacteria bacterium]|nr:class I SAM-dependent methyltransferase [Candidatus Goldiibacteriota bacterium]